MEQDIASQVVGLGGTTDFSLWKLFLRADFVVKSVIIVLIAACISSRKVKINLRPVSEPLRRAASIKRAYDPP